jgi:dihydroorotase-like cyclic amidohydrolase
MAMSCAKDTGCALHVVHVSAPEGIDLIHAAKREGIDVTAETCPHYLLLDTWDAERIGAAAKCAPPLRPPGTVEGLWKKLAAGEIDTIGSDHSPSPPELKEGDDFFSMWGGIAGSQHGFPLVLERAVGGGMPNAEARMTSAGRQTIATDSPVTVSELADRLGVKPYELLGDLIKMEIFVAPHQTIERSVAGKLCEMRGFAFQAGATGEQGHPALPSWGLLAAVFATNPARRFRLDSRKGRIAEGLDADFCLVVPDDFVIETKDLLARHPISPYVGMRCAWRVEATWLRGNPVSPATHGRFLTPDSP